MRSSVSVILSSPAPDTTMSHPDYEQTAHDHAALLILVKHIGTQLKPKFFIRMFERISRVCQERIEDSSGVVHAVTARYIKEYPVENNDWGDFQTHRRLLGLITVGKYDSQQELNELCRLHESLKVKYSSTLFDSRCVLLGFAEPPYPPPSNFKASEALWYAEPDSCTGLESQLSTFLNAVFWVLESKRLERGREKIDRVSLLQAPFEKKDFVGLDLESRVNRKRCVGRMTKHLGDLSLQSGLFAEALNYYTSASEVLRGVNDWLWLGGALEGLCATSVVVLLPNRGTPLQRNASLPEGSPGKQRCNSVTKNSIPKSVQPADIQQLQQEMNNLLTPEDMLKRYREAIIHYSKYQNAGIIETEASFKASRIAIEQNFTLQAASFLQNVIFINLPLSEQEKIQRFTSLSDLYSQIGFLRKASFFRRLAATRHVSSQNPQPNWSDCYQLMLHALRGHRLSLDPAEISKDEGQGWPALQVQLLQELVVAAKRAGLPALATRHMTFLLQSMWAHLGASERRDLALQLQALAAQCEGAPVPLVLDTGQVVPPANLTSVPFVKSFSLQNLPAPLRPQKLETQQEDSGPFLFTPIHFGSLERRTGASSKMDYHWVVGDTCEVSLELANPLPFELKVSNMLLLTSGSVFESLPSTVVLTPDSAPQSVKLSGIPKEDGELEVLGFSTHTLGVKSNIRLRHLSGFPHPQLQVDVVPALPQLTVTVTPPASAAAPSSVSPSCLGTAGHVVASVSLALYAGQSVEVGVQLKSTGSQPVQLLEAAISSPLDAQLQAQVFQFSAENLQAQLPLPSGSTASLTLYLHSAAEFLAPGLLDTEMGSLPASSLVVSSQSTSFMSGSSSLPSRINSPALPARRHDLTASFRSQSSSRSGSSMSSIRFPGCKVGSPNTPKILEGHLKLRYSGGPGLTAGHCRMCSVTINLEMLPSILIIGWDVLPAETNSQFYLVLDAANASSVEVELQYAPGKSVLMEGGESCRVPVPVPRCPLAKLAKLYDGVRLQPDEHRALEQVCAEHVVSQVDLRWRMPAQGFQGRVSLKGLSLTPEMLDVVRMSPVQWDVTVDGQQVKTQPQEELSAVAGQLLTLGVNVTNTLEKPLSCLSLALQFYQDHQNGAINYRLDTRLASAGATTVLIPKLLEQKSAYHECSVVFFTPGQYKADIQCMTQLEGEETGAGHVWKFTPAVCISVLDPLPN